MEAIPLPNRPQVNDLGQNKYNIVFEPLYPGYGITVGNALRRVLLSSMPGAAVTSVKIKFVDHEFSTVPNVKEDVIQIILNLKQLRLKSHSSEPVRLVLKEKGEKEVTAASIKETDQVEVINKDLHIATLDNKNSDFEMELVVEQGRGYMPVEARENQKLEVGMIAVDAIFTPIKSVHFDVSNVRVGQFTNYDKLSIMMETDGSISGDDAIDVATHILVDHFSMMFKNPFLAEAKIETMPEALIEGALEVEEPVAENSTENEISASALSTRAKNALSKNGITSFKTLKSMTPDEVMNLAGLGEKSAKEIVEYLERN